VEETCATVEAFMDELVYWTADRINEILQPLEEPDRIGFRITWENQWAPESVTLWMPKSVLKNGGAWARALGTQEGRMFVAQAEEGSFYWCQHSPKYTAYGQVLFDP